MSLELLINNSIKEAMRSKDRRKLEALRAIKSALLLEKTGKDTSSGEIPEDVELAILQKLVKQRKESAAIYIENNRKELAEDELFQASVIEDFLPEQMSEEEIKTVIDSIIKTQGATSIKDMGKIMGISSKQLAGKADNKMIASIVKQMLNNI